MKAPSFLNGDCFKSKLATGSFLLSRLVSNRPSDHDRVEMKMTRTALNRLKLKTTIVEKRAKSCSTQD